MEFLFHFSVVWMPANLILVLRKQKMNNSSFCFCNENSFDWHHHCLSCVVAYGWTCSGTAFHDFIHLVVLEKFNLCCQTH